MKSETYRRSRLGCSNCKSRRVKCSENGPPCNECARGGRLCQYDHDRAPSTSGYNSSLSSINTEAFTLSPAVQPSALYDERHLLELELMHHYSTFTWQTFCDTNLPETADRSEQVAYFRHTLPYEALHSAHLRSTLFALTALHLASLSNAASRGSKYLRAALHYQLAAQSSFATYCRDGQVEDSMSVFSLLTLVLSLAIPRYLDPHLASIGSPMDDLIAACNHYRASFNASPERQYAEGAPSLVTSLFSKDISLFGPCEPQTTNALSRLYLLAGRRYKTRENVPGLSSRRGIVHELQAAFQRLQAGSTTVALGWLINAPDNFLDDLVLGQTPACLIFLHWCVLLHRCSTLWWTSVSGPSIVVHLASRLRAAGEIESADDIQAQAISWCEQQVFAPA